MPLNLPKRFHLNANLQRFSGGHQDNLYNFKTFRRCLSHRESKSVGCQMLKDCNFPYQVRSLRIVIADDVRKATEQKLTSILGGAGLAVLLVIIIVLFYYGMKCLNRWIKRAIKDHSFLSTSVEWLRARSPNSVPPSAQEVHILKQLTLSNLGQATRNFDQSSIVREGAHGTVYKGLLEDGSFVAVKKLLYSPIQPLHPEVKKLSCFRHKHLVKIVGICEENHQHFIIYDYISNGNVASHLYDADGLPMGKLDMRKRLYIAIGAAKGLEHLHSLLPPVLHMHFTTNNVLLDENFIAKVSDYGPFCLFVDNNALPSSTISCFLDPELDSFKNFSEKSDVYSFGVFMLELISGRQAWSKNSNDLQCNLLLQAKSVGDVEDFVDETLMNYPMRAMKQMLDLALICLDGSSSKRPSMKKIVEELEGIRKEIRHSGAIEFGNVTLGSDLFSSSSSAGQSPLS